MSWEEFLEEWKKKQEKKQECREEKKEREATLDSDEVADEIAKEIQEEEEEDIWLLGASDAHRISNFLWRRCNLSRCSGNHAGSGRVPGDASGSQKRCEHQEKASRLACKYLPFDHPIRRGGPITPRIRKTPEQLLETSSS